MQQTWFNVEPNLIFICVKKSLDNFHYPKNQVSSN